MADRKLKLPEIADGLKISQGSVFIIFLEFLSMRKLCSKWWLLLLTFDQKWKRVEDSERCLQMFQRNKKESLRKYVTIDETWIHHFTPESNQQSAVWTAAGESCPKWPKTQTSAGKVLASVCWDAQGILLIDRFEKGKTINSEYYITLLKCLKEEIAKKQHQIKKEKSARSPIQCTVSQIDRNDGKTIWITLRIASSPTLFSRSGPQQLVAVCRP